MQAPNPVLNPEHIIKYGTEKKITKKDKKTNITITIHFFQRLFNCNKNQHI